ncbi:MAG: hypothetical protein PVG29_09835, partial [Gammaproteobacteria bacterium]
MLERKTVPGNELPIPSGRRPDGDTLGQDDLVRFRKQLRQRAEALRAEIREGLIKYDEDQYQSIADRVGDFE